MSELSDCKGRSLVPLIHPSLLPIVFAGKVKQSVASVSPFVRIYSLLNQLMAFELEFMCVCFITIARIGLKVNVTG